MSSSSSSSSAPGAAPAPVTMEQLQSHVLQLAQLVETLQQDLRQLQRNPFASAEPMPTTSSSSSPAAAAAASPSNPFAESVAPPSGLRLGSPAPPSAAASEPDNSPGDRTPTGSPSISPQHSAPGTATLRRGLSLTSHPDLPGSSPLRRSEQSLKRYHSDLQLSASLPFSRRISFSDDQELVSHPSRMSLGSIRRRARDSARKDRKASSSSSSSSIAASKSAGLSVPSPSPTRHSPSPSPDKGRRSSSALAGSTQSLDRIGSGGSMALRNGGYTARGRQQAAPGERRRSSSTVTIDPTPHLLAAGQAAMEGHSVISASDSLPPGVRKASNRDSLGSTSSVSSFLTPADYRDDFTSTDSLVDAGRSESESDRDEEDDEEASASDWEDDEEHMLTESQCLAEALSAAREARRSSTWQQALRTDNKSAREEVVRQADAINKLLKRRKFPNAAARTTVGLFKTTPNINQLIQAVDLNALFARVQDSRRHHKRAHLLELFGQTRLKEITVKSRARLVRCLVRASSIGSHKDQRMITRMILSTRGESLYELKHMIDEHDQSEVTNGLNFWNLVDVVYVFVTHAVFRGEIIGHINRQGMQLLMKDGFVPPLHVLSDIDDTFVHSGLGLGGPKYPPGTTLPGVLQLYRELKAHMVFVTARPDWLSRMTYRSIFQYGLHSVTVLSGKLRDSLLIPFAPDKCNQMIAKRKFENYILYKQLFPECRFMWMGDSGQGDIITGLHMLAHDRIDCSVIGVYIQDVVESDGVSFKTQQVDRSKFKEQGVFVADNYLEVALDMYDRQIISLPALRRICKAAMSDLDSIQGEFEDWSIGAARRSEFERQLQAVNAIMEGEGMGAILAKAPSASTSTLASIDTKSTFAQPRATQFSFEI